MQAADERQLRITSTLEYGQPPRRVGSAFVSGITSAPHIFTHSTPGGITATVSVLPCNAHGNPDLNTENYVLALRQDTNTTYPLLAPMTSDPYLVHGSFKPDPCGGWELRIAWPNKPKPPARDADSDSAIHSLTKKYTPLRFQLVHCPTGWCSGLSQGFLLRTKWEPGKSGRYVEPLEYPPPPFCPALATAVAPLCAAWGAKQAQMGEGDGVVEGVDGAEAYALGGMPLPAAMAGMGGAGAGAGAAPSPDGSGHALASLAGLMPAPPPPVAVATSATSGLNALATAATGGVPGTRGRGGAAAAPGAAPAGPPGMATLSSLFAGAGAGPTPAIPGLLDSINAVMVPGAVGGAGGGITPALLKKIAPFVDNAVQRALQASMSERAAALAAAASSSSSSSSSGDAAPAAADGLVAAASLVAHLQQELSVPLPLAAVAATGAVTAAAAASSGAGAGAAADAAPADAASAGSGAAVGRKRSAAAAAAAAPAAAAAAAAAGAAAGSAAGAETAAPRSAKKARAGEEGSA